MKQRIIVVDDFYENPDEVRKFALACEYKAQEGHTYPGENSTEALNPEGQLEAFKKILGERIAPSRIGLHGHFRISRATDSFEQDVHVDPPVEPNEYVWAAVLYLNTPEQCLRPDGISRDGTLIWKHKARGLERVPMNPEEGQQLGFENYAAVRKELIYGDGLDRSKWELTFRVPMKYNRIVFFRPYEWHSHGENFGTTKENARLVQIFFFRKEV